MPAKKTMPDTSPRMQARCHPAPLIDKKSGTNPAHAKKPKPNGACAKIRISPEAAARISRMVI